MVKEASIILCKDRPEDSLKLSLINLVVQRRGFPNTIRTDVLNKLSILVKRLRDGQAVLHVVMFSKFVQEGGVKCSDLLVGNFLLL